MPEQDTPSTQDTHSRQELEDINETLQNIDLHLHRILATLEKIARSYGAIAHDRQMYTYTPDRDVREHNYMLNAAGLKDDFENCGRDEQE